MKSIKNFLGIVFFSVGIFSCTNDFVEDTRIYTKDTSFAKRSVDFINSDTIVESDNFIYNGKKYNIDYKILDDSVIFVSDTGIYNLVNRLYDLPNLITYLHRDGTVEYFDSKEIFNSRIEAIIEIEKTWDSNSLERVIPDGAGKLPLPETNGFSANLFLYDDDNYSGKMRRVHLPSNKLDIKVDHLKNEYSVLDSTDYDMNDKTTAFYAYTINGPTLFELFEDDHQKNHCLSFTTYVGDYVKINDGEKSVSNVKTGATFAPDLKNVRVKGTKRSSWNDRITSVRITRK